MNQKEMFQGIINDPAYLGILKNYEKALIQCRNLKKMNISETEIRSYLRDEEKRMFNNTQKYAKLKNEKIDLRLDTLKKGFEEARDKEMSGKNPNEEVIRRDNFRNKISLMEGPDLVDYMSNYTFDEFELSALKNEIKNKNMDERHRREAENILKVRIQLLKSDFDKIPEVADLKRNKGFLEVCFKEKNIKNIIYYAYNPDNEEYLQTFNLGSADRDPDSLFSKLKNAIAYTENICLDKNNRISDSVKISQEEFPEVPTEFDFYYRLG